MARFASYVEVLVAHLRSSPYSMLRKRERERERADVDATGVNYGVNFSSSSWSKSACIPETGITRIIDADYCFLAEAWFPHGWLKFSGSPDIPTMIG